MLRWMHALAILFAPRSTAAVLASRQPDRSQGWQARSMLPPPASWEVERFQARRVTRLMGCLLVMLAAAGLAVVVATLTSEAGWWR